MRSLAERLAATDERVAVTGATGWFGRVTLDVLGEALGTSGFRDRVTGYASRERAVDVRGVGSVELRPLASLAPAEVLLHYAFLTTPHVREDDRQRFVATNVAITSRVVAALADVPALETGRVRRLFTTSSGAARRPDLEHNPYGALKRLDELAFSEACRQHQATLVVARVFNVGGPHMSRPRAYALGDLILRAQAGEPLVVDATGAVVRSYVAVEDVVRVALGELLAGRDAFFETAGARRVEVEELAGVVRSVAGRPALRIERTRDPDAASSVYVGDGTRFEQLARAQGVALQDLEAIVAATARGLAQPG